MKIRILFFLIFASLVFAQEGTKSSVELPTFVITGKDIVELPIVNKMDVLITQKLPESSFNPVFKPIRFSRKEFKPAYKEITVPEYIFDPQLSGAISLNFGNIITPAFEGDIMYLTKELAVNGRIGGYNSKAYVLNSEKFVTRSYVKIQYYPFESTGMFSDVHLNSTLNTHYKKFRLFGSMDPARERNLNSYDIGFSLDKGKDTPYLLNLNAENRSTIIKEEGFNGNLWDLSANFGVHFTNFRADLAGKILSNKETQNNAVLRNNMQGIEATISGIISGIFELKGGVNYSKNSTESKISPVSSMKFRLTDNFELGADYGGGYRLNTNSGLIRLNNYLNVFSLCDLSHYRDKHISAFAKFEEEKIICAVLTAGQFSDLNLGLIDYQPSTAKFVVDKKDAETKFVRLELTGYMGPFGSINTVTNYSSVKLKDGTDFPGFAPVDITFDYRLELFRGFETSLSASYKSPVRYSSIIQDKLDGHLLFSAGTRYSFSDNFIFNLFISNLSDQKYYNWYNYPEPGRSIEAGLIFNW